MSAELLEPLDVVAVGAHPDDVEIAVGGSLAAMARRGYRVGIIDLTDGEPTPGSPGPETRLAEARRAAEILGVVARVTLELPNRRLFDSFEARVAVAKLLRRWRPAIVLGIAAKTPTASPDHWQAVQITDAAVFYARLTKWDEHFDGLPVHSVRKQLWYPLGFGLLELPPSGGAFVADISHTLDLKLAAIRAYASQFPKTKERIFTLVESQARLWGQSAGFQAGEMLLSATTFGVPDPVATLCPDLARGVPAPGATTP